MYIRGKVEGLHSYHSSGGVEEIVEVCEVISNIEVLRQKTQVNTGILNSILQWYQNSL